MFLTEAGVKVKTHITTFSAENRDDGELNLNRVHLSPPIRLSEHQGKGEQKE